MIRKKEFLGIVFLAVICLLLITFREKDSHSIRNRPISFQAIEIEQSVPEDHISIEEIVNAQRSKLLRDLQDYKLPSKISLSNLTLDTGGQPIRTVIITTWRSGSTFLGIYFL